MLVKDTVNNQIVPMIMSQLVLIPLKLKMNFTFLLNVSNMTKFLFCPHYSQWSWLDCCASKCIGVCLALFRSRWDSDLMCLGFHRACICQMMCISISWGLQGWAGCLWKHLTWTSMCQISLETALISTRDPPSFDFARARREPWTWRFPTWFFSFSCIATFVTFFALVLMFTLKFLLRCLESKKKQK